MAPDGKEKKRKATPATPAEAQAPRTKKTKKAKAVPAKLPDEDVAATTISAAQPTTLTPAAPVDVSATLKIKPRKRAVDFMSADEEEEGGVSVDNLTEANVTKSQKAKKRKAQKEKSIANSEAAEQESAAPKQGKPRPTPKSRKAVATNGEATPASTPKKKGITTVNLHAEKIKRLLGQKDNLPGLNKEAEKTAGVSVGGSTADGVNGLSGKADDQPLDTATKGIASTSTPAKAPRSNAKERTDKQKAHEDVDQAAALLKGFDSDSEDPAEDEGFVEGQPIAALPKYKKTQKKLRQAAQNGNKEGPGVVYVGRIPHGFYEKEMRQYFSQFGPITKLRLSRNRKTGHSKHFAFLEFESNEVAKIVAETMDNYLLFGHILKCKYVPAESLHPETFQGANKRFHVAPRNRMEKRALEAPRTESHWNKTNQKEQKKREKKAEKLKEIGYDIELPDLKSPADVLQRRPPHGEV